MHEKHAERRFFVQLERNKWYRDSIVLGSLVKCNIEKEEHVGVKNRVGRSLDLSKDVVCRLQRRD